MTDPLNDPRFPDRPTHPDFWRISEILLANDGAAGEGGRSIPEITAAVVDMASLTYAAQQRALIAIRALHLPSYLLDALVAVWIDAFTAGATFQQRGGHRHADNG